MKINGVEKKEKSTVQITVQFDAREFEDALNEVYKKNRHSIAISGFRKGKAPRKIVEHMYGEDIFHEDAVNLLCPDAFEQIIAEENLEIVGKPMVDDFSADENKELIVNISVGVYPEVTLGKYKGLSGVKVEKVATDKDIAGELEALQNRNARVETVDREAKNEDTVVIDFKGYLDGAPFDGGEAEQQPLKLGSNSFVPGFEEQLVGVKAGDEVDVKITFPEEYTEELKGKEAIFKVKVQEVKETILPELDDEFAKDVSEFDTLEEFKNSIRDNLNSVWEEESRKDFNEDLITQASENMEAEIPESMVMEQSEMLSQEFYYSVTSQGMKPDDYLAMMGLDKATFMQANMRNAHRRVTVRLLLTAIAEAENLEATEDEIDAKYKEMTESYQMDEEKVRQIVSAEDIAKDIKMDRAAEIIFSSAIAKAPEKEEEKAQKPEEASTAPAKKTTKKTTAKTEGGAEESKPKAKKAPAKKKTTKKADAEVTEETK